MNNNLISDASFYLCFLDDIKKPEHLIKILESFEAHVSPTIKQEIERSPRFPLIKSKLNCFEPTSFYLGEAVRPLFSKKEIKKRKPEIKGVSFYAKP